MLFISSFRVLLLLTKYSKNGPTHLRELFGSPKQCREELKSPYSVLEYTEQQQYRQLIACGFIDALSPRGFYCGRYINSCWTGELEGREREDVVWEKKKEELKEKRLFTWIREDEAGKEGVLGKIERSWGKDTEKILEMRGRKCEVEKVRSGWEGWEKEVTKGS